MECKVENLFGAGNYVITGENAENAAKEYSEMLEGIYKALIEKNGFELEGMFVNEVNNATLEIAAKHNVEVNLVLF